MKPISRRMPTVPRRSSTSITIRASRNTALPTTVTMAMARWKRSRTTKVLVRSSGADVGRATAPGSRAASSRANGAASAGWVSATLIAVTVSSDPGSDGSATSDERSGRCIRTSNFGCAKRNGSGVGSYTPSIRNARALGAGRLAGQPDDVADAETARFHQLPRHEDARDRGRLAAWRTSAPPLPSGRGSG